MLEHQDLENPSQACGRSGLNHCCMTFTMSGNAQCPSISIHVPQRLLSHVMRLSCDCDVIHKHFRGRNWSASARPLGWTEPRPQGHIWASGHLLPAACCMFPRCIMVDRKKSTKVFQASLSFCIFLNLHVKVVGRVALDKGASLLFLGV